MKLTSFSKSVRAIGVMAMLSVTIATTLQQPVQAQTIAKDDNGVCSPLPQGVFYQEFGGITFSQDQKAAYRKIEAKINRRYRVVLDNLKFKPGTSDKKANEIIDASVEMGYGSLSSAEQVKRLTKKYGKYAIFERPKAVVVYTPEQVAKGKQIGRDFEAQTMDILTPEQQKIYKVNLALQQRIRACVPDDTPADRIISPLPY
jgi:hypothetical protein